MPNPESTGRGFDSMNLEDSHDASCCAGKPSAVATDQPVDPVCGMTVSADSPHRSQHEGHDYRFCSAGCREKFEADPGRYTKAKAPAVNAHGMHAPAQAPAAVAPAGTIYTCPMHPQIRQTG